jgi:hypothetical protein
VYKIRGFGGHNAVIAHKIKIKAIAEALFVRANFFEQY